MTMSLAFPPPFECVSAGQHQQGLCTCAPLQQVWTVSWLAQLQVCTVRAIVQQMRGIALPLNAALVLLAGGLLGQLYNDVQINQVTNNNFLTSLAIGLTSVQSSLACFAAERPVFWREVRGLRIEAFIVRSSAPVHLSRGTYFEPCSQSAR